MISLLFVDDTTDTMARIRAALEKTGEVRLDVVSSIKQATEKLKSRTYDIILSYEQMPDVNGIEFVPDMDGVGFLKFLKTSGITTPVILYCRRGQNRIAFEEVINGIEFAVPGEGELRAQASDIVLLAKQTMMRRKADREVKLSNDQLTAILSATPLGIFQMRNDVIEWTNRQLSAMLGYNESHLVGKPVRLLFPSEEGYEQACRDFLGKHAGSAGVDCDLAKSGVGTIACSIQPLLLDPNNAKKGGTFVVTDLTERKLLKTAIKDSEARYREVLQNSQSIILRMDTQGTVTFMNAYGLMFFDFAADDVVGKNILETIVPQKNRAGHDLSMVANDLGFNAEGYAVNISENVRRNGDRVWIAWINKAVRDDQGKIGEILCIGHDITDRRQGGQARIRTDTWKDQVIAETDVHEDVFDAVFHICTEISIDGREGKAIGTTFIIGDAKNVMVKSRQLNLNPYEGHQPESRMVTNPDIRESVKEFSQMDGAFVVRGDGFIEASGRYITVDTSGIVLPKGMGTRHNSVAAITKVTRAVGIVVSQSGGGITIFKNGQIVKKISL